jgi:uncharacterized protein (TIGR03382 family)
MVIFTAGIGVLLAFAATGRRRRDGESGGGGEDRE